MPPDAPNTAIEHCGASATRRWLSGAGAPTRSAEATVKEHAKRPKSCIYDGDFVAKAEKREEQFAFYAPTLEGLKSLRHAAQPRFWGLVGHALYSPGPGVLCLEGGPKRLALPKPQERAERRSDCTCDPTELLRL